VRGDISLDRLSEMKSFYRYQLLGNIKILIGGRRGCAEVGKNTKLSRTRKANFTDKDFLKSESTQLSIARRARANKNSRFSKKVALLRGAAHIGDVWDSSKRFRLDYQGKSPRDAGSRKRGKLKNLAIARTG